LALVPTFAKGKLCGCQAPRSEVTTGTTTNHTINVDEEEDRGDAMTVAPSAIGAGIEIGRATP
jgi:hypothetical protein